MTIKVDNDTGEITNFHKPKEPPFLRTGHNYCTDTASNETAIACNPDDSKTQQQFAEEVDINTIVERFGLTGQLPDNPRMPQSGDFTNITDFQSAMNQIRQAQEAFMEFPADIRAEFNNDPQRMMDFLDNPKNRERALEMGLLATPPEKTRDMIQAIDELGAKLAPANPATTKESK